MLTTTLQVFFITSNLHLNFGAPVNMGPGVDALGALAQGWP